MGLPSEEPQARFIHPRLPSLAQLAITARKSSGAAASNPDMLRFSHSESSIRNGEAIQKSRQMTTILKSITLIVYSTWFVTPPQWPGFRYFKYMIWKHPCPSRRIADAQSETLCHAYKCGLSINSVLLVGDVVFARESQSLLSSRRPLGSESCCTDV